MAKTKRGKGDAAAVAEPTFSVHEQKQGLQELHRLLVCVESDFDLCTAIVSNDRIDAQSKM